MCPADSTASWRPKPPSATSTATPAFYHYRGHSAVDLARTRRFEDVWHLLVVGALPDDPGAFAERIAAAQSDDRLAPLLSAVRAQSDQPLAVLRAVWTLAASLRRSRALYDLDEAGRLDEAIAFAAMAPLALAPSAERMPAGRGVVSDYLERVTGATPHEAHVRALSAYLVAAMDHGFNASTFTAPVIASTGADMASCLTGALGALSGPLHGEPRRGPSTASTPPATTPPRGSRRALRRATPHGLRARGVPHGRSAVGTAPRGRAGPRRRPGGAGAGVPGGGGAAARRPASRAPPPGQRRVLRRGRDGAVRHPARDVHPDLRSGPHDRLDGARARTARDPKIIRPAARYVGPGSTR